MSVVGRRVVATPLGRCVHVDGVEILVGQRSRACTGLNRVELACLGQDEVCVELSRGSVDGADYGVHLLERHVVGDVGLLSVDGSLEGFLTTRAEVADAFAFLGSFQIGAGCFYGFAGDRGLRHVVVYVVVGSLQGVDGGLCCFFSVQLSLGSAHLLFELGTHLGRYLLVRRLGVVRSAVNVEFAQREEHVALAVLLFRWRILHEHADGLRAGGYAVDVEQGRHVLTCFLVVGGAVSVVDGNVAVARYGRKGRTVGRGLDFNDCRRVVACTVGFPTLRHLQRQGTRLNRLCQVGLQIVNRVLGFGRSPAAPCRVEVGVEVEVDCVGNFAFGRFRSVGAQQRGVFSQTGHGVVAVGRSVAREAAAAQVEREGFVVEARQVVVQTVLLNQLFQATESAFVHLVEREAVARCVDCTPIYDVAGGVSVPCSLVCVVGSGNGKYVATAQFVFRIVRKSVSNGCIRERQDDGVVGDVVYILARGVVADGEAALCFDELPQIGSVVYGGLSGEVV